MPQIGNRQDGQWLAVCTSPSVNFTPMGSSMPPVPYLVVQELSNSAQVSSNVRFNKQAACTLNSYQPSCRGDEAGTGKGILSGTVSGEVRPLKGSSTVRVNGHPVIRVGDPCTMNGGNCPGVYVMAPAPASGPLVPLPPVLPPEKISWWDAMSQKVLAAVENPGEGMLGAVKDLLNTGPELLEILLNGNSQQLATELERTAALQNVLGRDDSATQMRAIAAEIRNNKANVPKFAMTNPAQEGGSLISALVGLVAGGAGLAKIGVKGIKTAAQTAPKLASTAQSGGAAKLAATTAQPASTLSKLENVASPGVAAKLEASATQEALAPPAKIAKGGDGVTITKLSTNHEKAAFSERKAYDKMVEKGYEPVGKTDGIYQPGETGIDSIYRNPTPPPDYIVAEVKYGTAALKKGLADGTNQMDQRWILRRLMDKVDDPVELEKIIDAMHKPDGVGRWLVRVKEDGSMQAKMIDVDGNIIRGAKGVVNGF